MISHLDYANALYYGLPQATLAPMQRLLHQAAKLILIYGKYDSATEAMRTLHWLPVSYRSHFKVACLVFRSLMGTAPTYLRDLLTVRITSRFTRSTSGSGVLLNVPSTKLNTFADRSFSVAGPKIWNDIPSNIRIISDYYSFKRQLKTLYFKRAYLSN